MVYSTNDVLGTLRKSPQYAPPYQSDCKLGFHIRVYCSIHTNNVINKKTKKSELVSRLLIIIFTMSRDRVPKKGFRQKRNIKNNI